MNKTKKKKSVLREWVESLLIALVLALFIRAFFVQAFKIPTGSMRPTLMEGDRILVNKFIYGARIPFTKVRLPAVREPRRGDVIVFVYPGSADKFTVKNFLKIRQENPDLSFFSCLSEFVRNYRQKDYIKRVAALEGEKVEIIDGNIYVNDSLVNDPGFLQRYYYNRGQYAQEGNSTYVPKDSLFVLGDNSRSSMDSRYWGFVAKDYFIGKAFLIYWPPNRIQLIR